MLFPRLDAAKIILTPFFGAGIMDTRDRKTLIDLLTLPTAPLCEQYVAKYIRGWVRDRPDCHLKQDEYGNLRIHLRRGPAQRRPLLFSAHMDHPGFEAERMLASDRLLARWRGWVPPEYFAGTKVRFYSNGRWIRGKVSSTTTRVVRGRLRVQTATIAVRERVERGSIGMWDLPDPTVRGSRIYARGCDDVAGVAAVLCALDVLRAGRTAVDVYALLTRAEELGWTGAIVACRSGILPSQARIVAVETSSELPGASLGEGPILRVGDSTGTFTPGLTAFCHEVGLDLARRDRSFKPRRKLMDGGSTETLPYLNAGYEATGMCVALGNYHNMDRRRGRIGPEFIDLGDFAGLVRWFAALARSRRSSDGLGQAVPMMVRRLDRTWASRLRRTADRVSGV